MAGPPKVEGADRLDRWAREAPIQHRALLLFAMQAEGVEPRGMMGRSLSAVSRAVGRGLTTARGWVTKRRWAERIEAHGDDAAVVAVRLYRALYLRDYGAEELPVVQHLVSERILEPEASSSTMDRTNSDVAEEAQRLVSTLIVPEPDAEDAKRVSDAMEEHRERRAEELKVLRGLLRKSLAYFKGQLEDGRVRVQIGDLPRIHEMLQRLEDEDHSLRNPGMVGADAVEDSVRVKLAKATDGDVRGAMREDMLEVLALLDGIEASEDQRQADLRVIEGGAEGNGTEG